MECGNEIPTRPDFLENRQIGGVGIYRYTLQDPFDPPGNLMVYDQCFETDGIFVGKQAHP
jgi:hypothetical protein